MLEAAGRLLIVTELDSASKPAVPADLCRDTKLTLGAAALKQ
jgi:hypothetical protein